MAGCVPKCSSLGRTAPLALFLFLLPSCRVPMPDPPEWGNDHVGAQVPEYVTGDECLFCHRSDIGPSWAGNRHHLTIREAERDSPPRIALAGMPALRGAAEEAQLVLGGDRKARFLK